MKRFRSWTGPHEHFCSAVTRVCGGAAAFSTKNLPPPPHRPTAPRTSVFRPQNNSGLFQQQYPPSPSGGDGGGGGEGKEAAARVGLKPLPVRAAIDVGGGGGVLSLAVGRVDVHRMAVQKLFYQVQLPILLESNTAHPGGSAFPNGSSSSSNRAELEAFYSTPFVLSERCMADITNKLHTVKGLLKKDVYEGISEVSVLLSFPLCLAQNIQRLALELARTFHFNVKVLGVDYEASALLPFFDGSDSGRGSDGGDSSARVPKETEKTKEGEVPRGGGGVDPLKALLRRHKAKSRTPRGRARRADALVPRPTVAALLEQTELLSFLSHSALTECLRPQRLLVIHEESGGGGRAGAAARGFDSPITVVGLNTTAEEECLDFIEAVRADLGLKEEQKADEIRQILARARLLSGDGDEGRREGGANWNHLYEAPGTAAAEAGGGAAGRRAVLVHHTLPLTVADVQRHCLQHIQRRSLDPGAAVAAASPNPLLPAEFLALADYVCASVAPLLPAWVRRKSALGGVIAGTAQKDDALYTAARVAGRAPLSLQRLTDAAVAHFCPLTDFLLAANFAHPRLVLSQAALTAGVMRALETPRVAYVPEATPAAALLLQPRLWTSHYATAAASGRPYEYYYIAPGEAARAGAGGRQPRTAFLRPHARENPVAAPDALKARLQTEKF